MNDINARGHTAKLDKEGQSLLDALNAVKPILAHGRLAAARHIVTELSHGRPWLGWKDDAKLLLSDPR